ncbi:MAG: glycine--tRNA ligase subunit beta [Thermodesulfobacteria bacterium]|nr:glycine--tRNA ligase subunit beta [Thermodesulfobacteriota bacterium]
MAKDLLFEIGTEELPARFIDPALEALKRLAAEEFKDLGLTYEGLKTLGTPRRLTLYVAGLAEKQPDRTEELLGPPASAAFDEEGNPTKAALGFAKKHGVSVEDLEVKETPKGKYIFLEKTVPGKETFELLPGILTRLITSLPFPKSMRWGSYKIRFARPIRWLLALYGKRVVPLEIAGLKAQALTYGHRFMAPEAIEIEDFIGYVRRLREAFVIVEPEERLARTKDEITDAALEVRGEVLEDPELLHENANLVEFPYATLGKFDEKFLALPRPVLITAMREHQRYFAVVNKEGELLPYFVAVNNTRPPDPSVLRAGHERVLRARLEDASFYFERDKKIPLAERVKELASVVYHAKLGTLYDKTKRLEALSTWLAKKLAPEKLDLAQRAAHLAKADLVTELVQEFPSLQGLMGREYARLFGEPEEVAEAIYEHYLPLTAGGELPRTTVGALVALADKMDTLCAFFGIGERPTGTADPFGLRRAAYGIIEIILARGYSLSLTEFISEALKLLAEYLEEEPQVVLVEVKKFIGRRLEGALANRGFEDDFIRAVMAVGFDDLVDVLKRLEALKKIKESPDFPALAVGFKRVMNMVKKLDQELPFDEKLLVEEAERELYETYRRVREEVLPYLEASQYEKALQEMLALKGPIDRFFDEVFVMVEDEALRQNRLALLQRIARLFLSVADLSFLREEPL